MIDSRPVARKVRLDPIPRRLRIERRWCVWQFQWKRDEEKWTKVPMTPDGRSWLKWGSRETWITFAEACAAYGKLSLGHDGIGFFLGDGFGGIDLDGVVYDRGDLTSESQRIVDTLDTYTEMSPRGRGPKMIFRGSAPTLTPTPLAGEGTIESYSSGRFFTITGNVIEGPSREVEERSKQATAIIKAIAPDARNSDEQKAPISDAEMRQLVINYGDGTRHETRIRLIGHLAAKNVSQAFAEELFVVFEQASAIVQGRKATPPAAVRRKVASIYAKHAAGIAGHTRCSEKYALTAPLEEL